MMSLVYEKTSLSIPKVAQNRSSATSTTRIPYIPFKVSTNYKMKANLIINRIK
jgi:hypothetical protein